MKSAVLVGLVGLFAGCSSDDESPPCSLAHREGTYLAHFTEHADGTCGAISDQVVVLNGEKTPLPSGCAFVLNEGVTTDKCSLTRYYKCPLDGMPGSGSFIAVSAERDGGAKLTGTLNVNRFDDVGMLTCVSTYEATYTRQ